MMMTTTCPGCGSTLTIEENAGEVVCQYCGTHFRVNQEGVNPSLQAEPGSTDVPAPNSPETPGTPEPDPGSSSAPAWVPDPATDIIDPPPATPPGDFYNPPLSGSVPPPPIDPYNPPIANAGADQPGFPYNPTPFGLPTSRSTFLGGPRTWIAIAVVAVILFCSSCVCLLYAVQRAVQ